MLPHRLRLVLVTLSAAVAARIRVFADPRNCPAGTVVIFPQGSVTLACGIAAIVEIAREPSPKTHELGRATDL